MEWAKCKPDGFFGESKNVKPFHHLYSYYEHLSDALGRSGIGIGWCSYGLKFIEKSKVKQWPIMPHAHNARVRVLTLAKNNTTELDQLKIEKEKNTKRKLNICMTCKR